MGREEECYYRSTVSNDTFFRATSGNTQSFSIHILIRRISRINENIPSAFFWTRKVRYGHGFGTQEVKRMMDAAAEPPPETTIGSSGGGGTNPPPSDDAAATSGAGGGKPAPGPPPRAAGGDGIPSGLPPTRPRPPAGEASSASSPPPPIPLTPPPDEERVARAEAFLRRDDISDVSERDKRRYLEGRAGMTPGEVDAALERAAAGRGRGGAASAADDADDGANGRRRRDGGDYYDDYDDRGRGSHRRDDDRFRDRGYRRGGPDDYRRGGDPRDGPPPRHPSPRDSNYTPGHSHPGGAEGMRPPSPPPPSSSASLPAWAGGFSLGVLCLAALRWLNGGDFVLFPPPTAAASSGATKEGDDEGLCDEDDTAESESSARREEGEGDGVVPEGGGEGSDEGGAAFDFGDDGDVGLGAVLDGVADARELHPAAGESSRPSYDELAHEIRALTSEVRSFRDVQERAARATAARAGRGVTDDAMDLLRRKKESEAASPLSLDEKEVATVGSLLGEVSRDLSRMKEAVSRGADGADRDAGADRAEESTSGSEGADDADKSKIGGKTPAVQIDEVMEKIQKLLALVEKAESAKPVTDKTIGGAANEEEEESKGTPSESKAVPMAQVEDNTQQRQITQPQPLNDESAQADERRLEEALRTLANDNDAAELKVGAQMLYLYCLNISKNPTVPRYRKIYTNNATFRTKVGRLAGAREFLTAVGFAERGNLFEWSVPASEGDSPEARSRLDLSLAALELMRNGTSTVPSPGGEGAAPSPSGPDALPAEAPGASVASVLSLVPDVGKGANLN